MLRNKVQYPALDGLRLVAVAWVVFHHFNLFFNLSAFFPESIFLPLKRFAEIGIFGVDIFFVISGFLISGLLFKDFPHHIRVKNFLIRRAFKIIPQYFLCLVGGIGLFFVFGGG